MGGLEHYIKALKEMVFLPLVYPELFERFHLSPPRGVLFYGPPGVLSLCLLQLTASRTIIASCLRSSLSASLLIHPSCVHPYQQLLL